MKRMRILFGQRRMMVLVTLTILVLAAAALAASSASFTSTSANPGNVFTAGSLGHTNSKDGSYILSVSKMKPGDVESGTVTIENTGDINGVFSIAETVVTPGVGTPAFAEYLELTITDVTTSTVIYGPAPLNGVGGSQAMGTIAPGAANAHTYEFSVEFPDNGPGNENQYKGASCEVDFDWTAVNE
jgi:hypothetical protein